MNAQIKTLLFKGVSTLASTLLGKILSTDLTRGLPLPGELAIVGWIWTTVFAIVGILVGIRPTNRNDPYRFRNAAVNLAIACVGAVFCFAVFILAEKSWKHLDADYFDYIYWGIEPLFYGMGFGFIAFGLAAVISQLDFEKASKQKSDTDNSTD